MAKLVIFEEFEDDEPIAEEFDLSAHQILIGSGPDNDLVLEAPDIDPTHASLELRHQSWVLQDLGGPGGTVVNGIEIQGPFQLHHGDLIELNQVKLRFEVDAPPKEAGDYPNEETKEPEIQPIRGRVWFASVAGATLTVVLIILLLLFLADFLGLLEMTDLLPAWFQ